MSTAQRNRAIKRVLQAKYGKNNVSVTGERGAATGWVRVKINDPAPVSNHAATRQMIVQTIMDAGIELGHYYDDFGDKIPEIIVTYVW